MAQRYNALNQLLTPNIILRNALMFSINNGDKYEDEEIDSGGSEFQISTLLVSDSEIYFLLICEYYRRKISDSDMKNIISFHVEKGLKNKDFYKLF